MAKFFNYSNKYNKTIQSSKDNISLLQDEKIDFKNDYNIFATNLRIENKTTSKILLEINDDKNNVWVIDGLSVDSIVDYPITSIKNVSNNTVTLLWHGMFGYYNRER